MFGGGTPKKQQMMERLRRAQAKNLSMDHIIEFDHTKKALDMTTEADKEKASKKRESKIPSAPKEIFEEMEKHWESGGAKGKAITKLAVKAMKYNKDKDGPFMRAFNSVSLELPYFRTMLKRVFDLDFQEDEFQEVSTLFDRHGNGTIDGTEFLTCFKLLGALAKKKHKSGLRIAEDAIAEKAKQDAELRKAQLLAKSEGKVDHTYTSADYDEAMSKHNRAARKFDKTGGASLAGFDQKFVSPGTFRELVKLTFNLILNPKELGAIVDYYDPDRSGIIESNKFLQQFLRLGIRLRAEALVQKIKDSKEAHEQMKIVEQQKIDAKSLSKDIPLDFTATDKEKTEFMEKLHKVAVKYDKSHPSSMGLDGFTSSTLKPGVLREMLKRTFHLVVDNKEVGILLKEYGNGTDDSPPTELVTEKFIMYFTRVGIKGRQARDKAQLERQRKENEDRVLDQQRKLEAQFKKLESGVDLNKFTDKDKETADKKLRYAALKYEKAGRSVPIDAFNSSHMEPGVFRELAKRIFNLILDPGELAAIVAMFNNGDQKVDCKVFMTTFAKLSFVEKDKIRREKRELAKAVDDTIKNEGKLKLEKITAKSEASAIDKDFSKHDKENAMSKLTRAAGHFGSKALVSERMTPAHLRHVLKTSYHLNLTTKEFTASIHDHMGSPSEVDMNSFKQCYFGAATEAKNENRAKSLASNREVIEAAKAAKKKKLEDQIAADLARLAFDSESVKSLGEKLKDSSYTYAVDSASFIGPLQSFKGTALTAHAFRDTYYRVFTTRLSLSEMGVLMDTLDQRLASERMISGEQFLKGFFKLGRKQERVLMGEIKEKDVDAIKVMRDANKHHHIKLPKIDSPEEDEDEEDGDEKKNEQAARRPNVKDTFLGQICGGRNPWRDIDHSLQKRGSPQKHH